MLTNDTLQILLAVSRGLKKTHTTKTRKERLSTEVERRTARVGRQSLLEESGLLDGKERLEGSEDR